jgi:hypothetical protein
VFSIPSQFQVGWFVDWWDAHKSASAQLDPDPKFSSNAGIATKLNNKRTRRKRTLFEGREGLLLLSSIAKLAIGAAMYLWPFGLSLEFLIVLLCAEQWLANVHNACFWKVRCGQTN